MFDLSVQTRIARSSGLAAIDYGAAGNQAGFEAVNALIGFWSDVLSQPVSDAEPRSWYRPPAESASATNRTADDWAKPSRAMFPSATPPRPASAAYPDPVTAQMTAWQSMLTNPWKLSPLSWPMAFMMMSSGLPESVAVPTASANAAAADAAIAATAAVRDAVSSYRSDGGHAVAQVIMMPDPAAAAAIAAVMVPFANAMLTVPWSALLPPRLAG